MTRVIAQSRGAVLAALVLLISFWPGTGATKTGAVAPELFARAERGPVQVIVHLDAGGASAPAALAAAQARVLAGLAPGDFELLRRLGPLPGIAPFMVVSVGPDALNDLAQSDIVESVVPDTLFRISDLDRAVSGLAPAGLDTSVALIEAPQVWDEGFLGDGKVIAIVDTGVDGTHPFLEGKVVDEVCYSSGRNCPNGQTQQSGPGAAVPCRLPFDTDRRFCAHGTHTAGVAVGNGDGYYGVAPEAKIIAAQVFSQVNVSSECAPDPAPCARAALSNILDALGYIGRSQFQNAVAAINVGVQTPEAHLSRTACGSQLRGHMALEQIIALLRLRGFPTVAPAGDGGYVGRISVPACLPSAFGVSGSYGSGEQTDTLWERSNRATRGPDGRDLLDFVAPGVDITSSVPVTEQDPDGYTSRSSTEIAAPHVSGAIALLRQAFPTATLAQIMDALKSTGAEIPEVTARRIQIYQAYQALQQLF